jgi:hypothetical protein
LQWPNWVDDAVDERGAAKKLAQGMSLWRFGGRSDPPLIETLNVGQAVLVSLGGSADEWRGHRIELTIGSSTATASRPLVMDRLLHTTEITTKPGSC